MATGLRSEGEVLAKQPSSPGKGVREKSLTFIESCRTNVLYGPNAQEH